MATGNWETLRREARRLENEIDSKLVAYSKIGLSLSTTNSTRTPGEGYPLDSPGTGAISSGVSERIADEIEIMLVKLEDLVNNMGQCLSSSPGSQNAPSTAMVHMLQRHREILNDYKQEFRKTRGNIVNAKEHNELLNSSRREGNNKSVNTNVANLLRSEGESLNNASNSAEAAVSTGLNLREELEKQRALFASMVERVETMGESVPAVQRLFGQIKRKRRRDILILAGVIGILTFLTLLWKLL